MQNQIHRGAKGLPRDRQRIAVVCRRIGRQGELDYWLKIKMLHLLMGRLANMLIFRRYAIVAKKAYRNHEEGTKEENHRWIAERLSKGCQ